MEWIGLVLPKYTPPRLTAMVFTLQSTHRVVLKDLKPAQMVRYEQISVMGDDIKRILHHCIISDLFGYFRRADIDNPDSIIIYYRAVEDSGEFTALPTSYNPVTKQVYAELAATEFGEFIFAYSDYASQTHAPLLVSPSDSADVDISNAELNGVRLDMLLLIVCRLPRMPVSAIWLWTKAV